MSENRRGAEADGADARKLWTDLLNPGEAEREQAERECGLRLPTREALSEVESSSRHYVEGEATYLSAALLRTQGANGRPELTPVGFILTPARLVTIRYAPLKAFDAAAKRLEEHAPGSPLEAFTVLVEEVVDRKADVLEETGAELERLSQQTFGTLPVERRRRASDVMRDTLTEVGQSGDALSKSRSSLLTLGRIVSYVIDADACQADPDLRRRLIAAKDDIASLTGYSETLSNKVAFLLDAVLGFINIDQNDVIKVLTVVSVVGVPPTLVASIYGMNFKEMPELNWHLGYPYALTLIVLTAVVPLVLFKLRGWF